MDGRSRYGKLLSIAFFLLAASSVAQVPVIKSIDKVKGENGDIIGLTGINFGSATDDLEVNFGASEATIETVSSQFIEVRVPSGATYNNISFTNKTTGYTALSPSSFFLTYSGAHGIETEKLQGQKDFDSESGLYDLCLCDFDGDGRTDIGATNQNSSNYTLLHNVTTAPGLDNTSFSRIAIALETGSLFTRCGDLNSDGKPDIVISEGHNGNRLFILKNTSTGPGNISFEKSTIDLLNSKPQRLAISDMDMDGKPDIIVTNQKGNTVIILKNEGNANSFVFSNAARTNLAIQNIPGNVGLDGLAVQDVNNDGRADIITSELPGSISNVYILPNKSGNGTLSFDPEIKYTLPGAASQIEVADLDHDGKPDIAASLLLNESIAILRNKGTSPDIAFESPVLIFAQEFPYGFHLGDLDGDGKLDMVVSSITKNSLKILNNESVPGSLQFTGHAKGTAYISRQIAIGDVDGDARPDICFTSVDDQNTTTASKVSVFRNSKCIEPKIDQGDEVTMCTGNPVLLTTGQSAALSYSWTKDDLPLSATGSQVETTESGVYAVTVSSDDGCQLTSNSVTVTFETDGLNTNAAIKDPGALCTGNNLALSIVSEVGATRYAWSGPGGYSAEGKKANPAIENISVEKSGRYTLKVFSGNCLSQETSIVINVIDLPAFRLNVPTELFVCDAAEKMIVLDPVPAEFTFQWFESARGELPGETTGKLLVTQSGDYYAMATGNVACATRETPHAKVTFTSPPQAGIQAPSVACANQPVNFINATQAESNQVKYKWDFGDGQVSTATNADHSYSQARSYTVKLIASYTNGQCTDEAFATLNIKDVAPVEIYNEQNVYNLCNDGVLPLAVKGSYVSYKWSTNETTPQIEVQNPGQYKVHVISPDGCTATGSLEVGLFPPSEITASAMPHEIIEGQSSVLEVVGLNDATWTPEETLDDPFSLSPVAAPKTTTHYVVNGYDFNGCAASAEIEVVVKSERASAKLKPKKYFSPNGDGINNYWTVEDIEQYPFCEVIVFDDKGVKVLQAKPYNNDWDGTINGKRLTEGVYFFMIKCEGEENSPVTGSVTLLR